MSRFRGTFLHTIDNKGRLSIPTRFREVLRGKGDDRVMVTRGVHTDCLSVFSMESWSQFEEDVERTPGGVARDSFIRLFISPAQDCALDKLGRILVPMTLRQEVGLEREVMVVGALNKFELWDRVKWEKYGQTARENALELLTTQNIRF